MASAAHATADMLQDASQYGDLSLRSMCNKWRCQHALQAQLEKSRRSVILNLCRQQNVADFMDEDELAVLQKSSVKTKAEYDTFGDTASEFAQRAAAADAQARPSAIPGAIFQDLIAPVPDSVGKLCMCDPDMYCTLLPASGC